jgi:uncharacterized glyoxalase superfamily protein PhnB
MRHPTEQPTSGHGMSHQTVFPSLRYRDAAAAIAWLERVLGMTVDVVVDGDGGLVAHAQLSHEGSSVLLGSVDSGERLALEPRQGTAWVYLVVDEVEPHFTRAVAERADVVEPVRNEDHGGRGYTVRDPEGNLWSVGSYRPDTPFIA